jgi:hypothetical protein
VEVLDQGELRGWVIESQRSHYSLGYWVAFFLGLFGQMVPEPPRITYTLRKASSGELRTVTLPGDHARSDLIEAIAQPQPATATESG